MIKRDLQPIAIELATYFPVIMISGPRQSGKTTLARATFKDKPYYNLEAPDIRDTITADPLTFFKNNPDGAILDEVQHLPELLSYIQVIVDESNKKGLFIVTGSCHLLLHQAITQSLAGRAGLLDLLPLSIHELQQSNISLELDEYLLKGFYPSIYNQQIEPTVVYRNYIRTYLERDVRLLINIKDLNTFQHFLKLTASRVGQLLNTESLGNDAGMSSNTIKNWLSVLHASYTIYRLQPYFENFGKRIIKSPKIYFTDLGIVCYLLSIESTSQVANDRIRGSLFENLVILELIKTRANQGKEPNLYFYRDNHGNEVDVIIKRGEHLIPIEIKSTATFNKSLLKNLTFYKKLVDTRMPFGFIVYTGEEEPIVNGIQFVNYKNIRGIYNKIDEL